MTAEGEWLVNRIVGLDALRFLCALCVVQGHLRLGGYWILDRLQGPPSLVQAVRVAFNQGLPIPTGPNAVIVFFVISGFCIHFPYREQRRLDARQFMVRRYLRVGLPALVAAVLLSLTGFVSLQDSVLWSIICELIYYSLYPLLLRARRRLGWWPLLAVSYIAAYAMILTHTGGHYNGDFTAFGASLTWVLGLPAWLLGCVLAEEHRRFRAHGAAWQWFFRGGIIACASAGTVLRFYHGVGYYWSQPVLAVLVFLWLGTEIAYFAARPPWRWLERCGKWSYSVYLFHAPISVYIGERLLPQVAVRERLLIEFCAVLLGSYVLYRLVERPSHLLARRYGAGQRRPADPAVSAAAA
jgi:peptidoglycan/LPS O-acetylase OafA/YrhL